MAGEIVSRKYQRHIIVLCLITEFFMVLIVLSTELAPKPS